MAVSSKQISVFEHQSIRLGDRFSCGGSSVVFDEHKLKAFQRHYGEQGVSYFSLIHNGIRFNEYVGVIQVGDTVVEVLPKADCADFGKGEQKHWRDILISMLLTVGPFNMQTSGSSLLKIKPNHLLDLYFELFLNEVEYLCHNGLIKKYHLKEKNCTSLKGSLKFSRHLQKNTIHQERFYVEYTVYDTEHVLHCILYKTIHLLRMINTAQPLQSRIGALLLNFPEMPDIRVTENLFDRIKYDRKTNGYKNAMSIARLLLLRYHPDVKCGCNNVLALMFDMNLLWEEFVYTSLYKHSRPGETIRKQMRRSFWQQTQGQIRSIRPDIVITTETGLSIVLDTKWKNIGRNNPSIEDLRQMYVYHEYFNAQHVALVYPGTKSEPTEGIYMQAPNYTGENRKCHIFTLSVKKNVQEWQKSIYDEVNSQFNHG